MNISKAKSLLKTVYPERIVVGYWIVDGGIVLNTQSPHSVFGVHEPGQFMVTEDGNVYGTNPVVSNLDDYVYHKLK